MPYRPSHRQLEYLVALAEKEHFGAAARACHVSQPTLSTQIKLLEDQLGAPLFERGPGAIRPTPTGAAIVPIARSVLSLLDGIVEQAENQTGNLGRLVRMGVAPTFGPYFMPLLLPGLHERYPQLEIYIREERPAALETALAEGLLDCIVTPGPLADQRLERLEICSERLWLGIAREHPLATLPVIRAADLNGERLMTLGRGHRLYDQVQRLCSQTGADLREDYEGTSLDALRQMVSIGMGLSLFPDLYARSEAVRDGRVVLRELEDWKLSRVIMFAWRSDSARQEHFRTIAIEAGKAAAAAFSRGE
ncbi:MAG: hydrogen peroxide-inducible genes activator [Nitratireductor sp.]|nr:hydrogen peroxide-inducible genes activator [Nitratireductor sp.]MCB1454706.1 hydrogen peroxide-inducible genes activator [Nitratireductor sp.]